MGKYALELNGVTKQYKDFKLDSISFTVPQGSIVGLIGENGAGDVYKRQGNGQTS